MGDSTRKGNSVEVKKMGNEWTKGFWAPDRQSDWGNLLSDMQVPAGILMSSFRIQHPCKRRNNQYRVLIGKLG